MGFEPTRAEPNGLAVALTTRPPRLTFIKLKTIQYNQILLTFYALNLHTLTNIFIFRNLAYTFQ